MFCTARFAPQAPHPLPKKGEKKKRAFTYHGTYPEIGGGKAVGGVGVAGGGGVGVVGVDVGQQGAHHRWHAGAHVLGGEAGKMPTEREGS